MAVWCKLFRYIAFFFFSFGTKQEVWDLVGPFSLDWRSVKAGSSACSLTAGPEGSSAKGPLHGEASDMAGLIVWQKLRSWNLVDSSTLCNKSWGPALSCLYLPFFLSIFPTSLPFFFSLSPQLLFLTWGEPLFCATASWHDVLSHQDPQRQGKWPLTENRETVSLREHFLV